MSGCFLNLPIGTEVKLEGLSNAAYNGKRGRITVTAPDLMARDRVAVIVDGNTLSFKRANVRRYFPSDDSDESDEAPGSDGEAARPEFSPIRKRAKSAAGGVFALSILTGWSSIETSTIVGVYATWAEVISKAKEILEKGNGYGENFWCTEENGGYREVYSDEEYEGEGFEDKTDTAKEPTGERYDVTCELATAQHCEGAKGNMILVAQRLTGVALA